MGKSSTTVVGGRGRTGASEGVVLAVFCGEASAEACEKVRSPAERWIGFGIVWVALVLLTVDSVLALRRTRAGQLAA